MLTYVNEQTSGLFGTTVLFGILVVAIIAMYQRDGDFSAAFVVGCFITTILSVLFKIMGLITDVVMFTFILATVGGFAYLWFKK